MFRNYLTTAWRNLVKNKFYSAINITGLTIGLTIGLLILLWVQDEFSYDRFNSNAPNIIKLENMVATGPARQLWTVTTAPIGIMAKQQIPGVKDVVRITENYYYTLFKYNNKVFTDDRSLVTDPSFFTFFDFKIINGNVNNPFPDSRSVVLTESTAKKYFGNEYPVGKLISSDTVNFKVTGIIKDFPKNSSIQGDMIFPMSLLAEKLYEGNTEGRNIENDFHQFDYNTFLLLEPGFSFNGFAKKLRDMHLSVKADDTDIEYTWLPLLKTHLYRADGGDGGIGTVRMFTIIALLILVIACINYVNLSTARSMLRAKEVSLRKIVGAAKIQLFLQFIVETALLFVIAVLLSLSTVYLLIPLFNEVSGKNVVVNYSDYRLWLVIFLTITGTLVVSSIYPAILLSSFEPIKALKGKMSAGLSTATFRKALVIVQFTFSIILISGTIVIGNQLKYIRSKQLGYDKENVLAIRMINMNSHLDAVKTELSRQPGVSDVTYTNADIIDYGNQTGANEWDGKEAGETIMVSPLNISKNFIPFFKMQLVQGRNFSGTVSDSTHFILNETAVKSMRIKDPIGKRFKLWKTEGTIIGVIKDFHFTSMRNKIKPAVFYSQALNYGNIYIKTTGKNAPAAIEAARKQWQLYNADFPFNYTFLDDSYNRLYLSEQRTGLLFSIFSAMAIFISCLGLFGLAAYTAQVRTKEIGVRKVLGASIGSILKLLAADFIKLVLIALVISLPIAWFAMHSWLKDFAYKVNIGWWVFGLAGLIAIVIAVLTISVQTIKCALANPIKSLRTE